MTYSGYAIALQRAIAINSNPDKLIALLREGRLWPDDAQFERAKAWKLGRASAHLLDQRERLKQLQELYPD